MSGQRIVTVVTCWTESCERDEEYFHSVHKDFDSALKDAVDNIYANESTPIFEPIGEHYGLKYTSIHADQNPSNILTYYVREKFL